MKNIDIAQHSLDTQRRYYLRHIKERLEKIEDFIEGERKKPKEDTFFQLMTLLLDLRNIFNYEKSTNA